MIKLVGQVFSIRKKLLILCLDSIEGKGRAPMRGKVKGEEERERRGLMLTSFGYPCRRKWRTRGTLKNPPTDILIPLPFWGG